MWQSFQVKFPEMDIGIRGGVDDLLVEKDGTISPFDFKTRGSAPQGGDYSKKYYQEQMDLYSLMLSKIGKNVSGKAHLAYYTPKKTDISFSMGISFPFEVTVETIDANPDNGMKLIQTAAEIINSDQMPEKYPVHELITFSEQYFTAIKIAQKKEQSNE